MKFQVTATKKDIALFLKTGYSGHFAPFVMNQIKKQAEKIDREEKEKRADEVQIKMFEEVS